MSYRVPNVPVADDGLSESGSSGSDSLDQDDGCSDWASDFGEALHTKSLFDDTVLPTPEECISHDKKNHGLDIKVVKETLGLDVYGLMRLVNIIRKEALTAKDVLALIKDDERLKDDSMLVPVIPDDPLLQLDFDDSWSDDEAVPAVSAQPIVPTTSTNVEASKIKALEAELAKARSDLTSMRNLLQSSFDDPADAAADTTAQSSTNGGLDRKGKAKIPAGRDDDTHYFNSYAENDIHEIMLKDTTRTVSYAKFILSNPKVFKDAIVMDVGCGTGILSMFAAKAGAKHVYAIEASGLATKARENIRNNKLDQYITVIQGKVENIELPVKHVDIIISEWMGYMLLYESMLDSVLDARDRFLAPGGLMAPSQTRLVLSGITGERVWKERVEFWQGVYGFDMTAMNQVYFNEGLVEYVDAKEVVTDECIVRDINTHSATPKSLDFHSAFTLTAKESTTIRAFLTHFDTFFSPHGGAEKSQFAPEIEVDLHRHATDEFESAVASVSGDVEGELNVSFTTGPKGVETHWRQVVFLLKEPMDVQAGQVIQGRFLCRKSRTNSRELDVEVHYAKAGERDMIVAAYKVK